MINQVTLVGRLTKDPELKITAEGVSVANVTLAVSRNFRNQKGEIDTDFVQCTLWRKMAENLAQYCRKGSLIGIIGRIQTRSYENQEGRRTYVTEVVAETVKFLGGRRESFSPEEGADGKSNASSRFTEDGIGGEAVTPSSGEQGIAGMQGAAPPLQVKEVQDKKESSTRQEKEVNAGE